MRPILILTLFLVGCGQPGSNAPGSTTFYDYELPKPTPTPSPDPTPTPTPSPTPIEDVIYG